MKFFLLKKNQKKKLNFLFFDLENYSNIVFDNLLKINEDTYFKLFVEEVKKNILNQLMKSKKVIQKKIYPSI